MIQVLGWSPLAMPRGKAQRLMGQGLGQWHQLKLERIDVMMNHWKKRKPSYLQFCRLPSIPKWLNWAGLIPEWSNWVGVDDSEETKASDSTVNIDEAVGYGFDMLKGIAKYVIYVIILTAIGFIIIDESRGDGFFLLMGVPFIIAAMVIYISLAIGVMYKLWVDILARSRK